MNDDTELDADTSYEPPTIVRLGSLTELTQGGTGAISDATGGSGDTGSI